MILILSGQQASLFFNISRFHEINLYYFCFYVLFEHFSRCSICCDCASFPCLNGGTCNDLGGGMVSCDYLPGSYNQTCSFPGRLLYSGFVFDESAVNDGSTDTVLVVTFSGSNSTNFTGVNGDDFISGGKIIANNIPLGFTAIGTRSGDKEIRISLIGNANAHLPIDDVSNLSFIFQNNSLSSNTVVNLDNAIVNNVEVKYDNNLSIPTLSQWGVIALSFIMLIFGTLGIQNRSSFKLFKNEPSAL